MLLAGMRAAPNLGPACVKAFGAARPKPVEAHGALLHPVFLDGIAGRPSTKPGGLHPTAAGLKAIVARILSSAERLIERSFAFMIAAHPSSRRRPT